MSPVWPMWSHCLVYLLRYSSIKDSGTELTPASSIFFPLSVVWSRHKHRKYLGREFNLGHCLNHFCCSGCRPIDVFRMRCDLPSDSQRWQQDDNVFYSTWFIQGDEWRSHMTKDPVAAHSLKCLLKQQLCSVRWLITLQLNRHQLRKQHTIE